MRAFVLVGALILCVAALAQSTSDRRIAMITALLTNGSDGEVWTKDSAELGRGKWAAPTTVSVTRDYSSAATASSRLSAAAFGALNATASAGTAVSVDLINIILRNGANAGAVTFNLDSEIAASNTSVLQGSWCQIRTIP